jgi:adenylate kinase family enzyme
MKIYIFGASGSGTTTLGTALSKKLNIPQYDADDYFWERTDPPFTTKRDTENRIKLLKTDLSQNDSWILTGSIMGWGDFIVDELDLAVYIYIQQSIRMERILKREIERYGSRIEKGNDM